MLNDLIVIGRDRWREELAREYEREAERLRRAYETTVARLRAENGALVAKLREIEQRDGAITAKAIRDLPERARLIARVEAELDGFAGLLDESMNRLKDDAVRVGGESALGLAQMTSGRVFANSWLRPDPEMLARMVGYLESDAMRERLASFGENAGQNVADVLLALTAQGKGSRQIADALNGWYQVPYAWAENMARTVQAWSYRGATHANYLANKDVITGWMWWSARDARVCVSCLAMHGTIHPLTDVLNDHHRGRCTPLPIVKDTDWWRNTPTGEDWFSQQDEATQQKIMGRGMLEAWRAGRVRMADLSATYQDEVYGEMRRAKTLGEALNR